MCVWLLIVCCRLFCFQSTDSFGFHIFALALVFSYDFHAGAETMFSRHFNDPAADSYFTKRKWGELVFPSFLLHAEIDPASALCTFARFEFVYSCAYVVIALSVYRCVFFHVCDVCGCACSRHLIWEGEGGG